MSLKVVRVTAVIDYQCYISREKFIIHSSSVKEKMKIQSHIDLKVTNLNPQMCFEFVVKLSMCAPFVDSRPNQMSDYRTISEPYQVASQSHNAHEEEKQHFCDQCEYRSKYNQNIKKHKKFCHPVEVDIMIVV